MPPQKKPDLTLEEIATRMGAARYARFEAFCMALLKSFKTYRSKKNPKQKRWPAEYSNKRSLYGLDDM